MSNNENSPNIAWGSMIIGAATAAAAVGAVAIFPASLGTIGVFVAANPAITIGTAAFAGGFTAYMHARGQSAKDEPESHVQRIEHTRMESRLQDKMEQAGCITCPTAAI